MYFASARASLKTGKHSQVLLGTRSRLLSSFFPPLTEQHPLHRMVWPDKRQVIIKHRSILRGAYNQFY